MFKGLVLSSVHIERRRPKSMRTGAADGNMLSVHIHFTGIICWGIEPNNRISSMAIYPFRLKKPTTTPLDSSNARAFLSDTTS